MQIATAMLQLDNIARRCGRRGGDPAIPHTEAIEFLRAAEAAKIARQHLERATQILVERTNT